MSMGYRDHFHLRCCHAENNKVRKLAKDDSPRSPNVFRKLIGIIFKSVYRSVELIQK
jgi:hypothetical protein